MSSSPRFPPILTWENPIKSGTVLAQILAVISILRYTDLFRLALRFGYTAIGVTTVVEFATRQLYGSSTGLISSYQPSRFINITQESIDKSVSCFSKGVACSIGEAKKLLDAKDLSVSIISFAGLFTLYILTGCLSITTLAFVIVFSAFTIPPAYLKFQKEVDELLAHVHKQAGDKYHEVHGQVLKAAGPHLDVAKHHINTTLAKVGINRGGFPIGSTGSKQDIPIKPTLDSVDVPGGSAISNNEPIPEKKAPKISEEASNILSSHEATKEFDSVPTILGNVSLDPNTSSTPTHPTAEDYISEIKDSSSDTIPSN